MTMDFKPAKHAELFTAAEKDERYFKTWIEDDLQEIAQRCLGVRRWVQFRSAITVLSRFGYFAINTLEEIPTLGEEFCETYPKSHSLTQRLMTILLNNDLQLPKEIPKPLVNLIRDVHMITFFLFGDFYQLSKRFTGVNHLGPNLTEPNAASSTSRWDVMNKLIGCMSIVRLMLNLPKQTALLGQEDELHPSSMQSSFDTTDSTVVSTHPDVMCQLCSSARKDPTSTLCGHIFCWYCIHNWVRDRGECPLCRMPTEPSRLIHLINFR